MTPKPPKSKTVLHAKCLRAAAGSFGMSHWQTSPTRPSFLARLWLAKHQGNTVCCSAFCTKHPHSRWSSPAEGVPLGSKINNGFPCQLPFRRSSAWSSIALKSSTSFTSWNFNSLSIGNAWKSFASYHVSASPLGKSHRCPAAGAGIENTLVSERIRLRTRNAASPLFLHDVTLFAGFNHVCFALLSLVLAETRHSVKELLLGRMSRRTCNSCTAIVDALVRGVKWRKPRRSSVESAELSQQIIWSTCCWWDRLIRNHRGATGSLFFPICKSARQWGAPAIGTFKKGIDK